MFCRRCLDQLHQSEMMIILHQIPMGIGMEIVGTVMLTRRQEEPKDFENVQKSKINVFTTIYAWHWYCQKKQL